MRVSLTSDVVRHLDGILGDDSNDGLAPSTAWRTAKHAYNHFRDGYDLAGHKVTIQVCGDLPGTASLQGCIPGQVDAEDFCFVGTGAAPWTYWASDSADNAALFRASDGARFGLTGISLKSTGAGGCGVVVTEGHVVVRDVLLGTMGDSALCASGPRSEITGRGFLKWKFEDTVCGLTAHNHGQINIACDIQISGAPHFARAFCVAELGGMIDARGMMRSIDGSASGVCYIARAFGIISTSVSDKLGFFPGNSPGLVEGGCFDQRPEVVAD